MSRIGRLPVAIPAGVEVSVAEGNVVTVKGPKGTLERALPTEMEIIVEDGVVKNIHITLKYGEDKNEKIITGLKRISKPGLRVYAGKEELPKVLGGLGIAILSTNKGVITDKEARKLQVGGEVLAFVW